MWAACVRRGRGGAGGGARGAATRVVTMRNLNPGMLKLEFAVRGLILKRANEIIKELKQGVPKPFTKVIKAHLGDAHAMGQKPITYIRQVLSCVAHPEAMQRVGFPEDVKWRARKILEGCGGGSMGSYTMSFGINLIRKDVAQYIERRDGHPADWRNVVLSAGASHGIQKTLQLFRNPVDDKPSGVMLPMPHSPIFGTSPNEYELVTVGFLLNEERNWALDLQELQRAYEEAMQTVAVRAIIIINPGNPGGQVLSREDIESLIKFAYERRLFLLADEVYQDNVYADDARFHSFKKVLMDMGEPYSTQQELASFMSISKGYMGECGLRGGWMELVNLDPAVQAELYKGISAMLCPPTFGQAAVDCVARPPQPGEPSYELWQREKCDIINSLKKRSEMVYHAFNRMAGVKCNPVQGALYAFPRVELPRGALAAADAAGLTPDTFYAMRMLEDTGICVVPGTGFKQKPGTHHFRTTILPQPDMLKEMLVSFKKFHEKFTEAFA